MTEPLNPSLHATLSRLPGGVSIANPGVGFEYDIERDEARKRWKLNVKVTGEYYVMTCPLCGGSRDGHRTLYINHAWQTPVKDAKGNVYKDLTRHLVICYRCSAEKQFVECNKMSGERVNRFVDYFSKFERGAVPGGFFAALRGPAQLRAGTVEAPVFIPPPPVILLRDLPDDHRARVYLRTRKGHPVDPDYASDVYGVGYAHTFPYGDETDVIIRAHQRANDRLIIPLIKDGKVVGWQGRVVDDNDARTRWYFPPGSKAFPFRNWDIASRFRGVLMVEGFWDEVAVGPSGLTLFTKDMNFQKIDMIVKQWDYAVICLDEKETHREVTDDNGQKRMGSSHVIYNKLLNAGISHPPVIFLYPADAAGKDPSAMGPQAFWAALQQQLSKEYFDAVSVPCR